MVTSVDAIVLSKLKYKDHDLIVKCYTKEYGVISVILRGVLKSKKGNSKGAYFQLLSQLQLVLDYKPNRTLQTVKETKVNYLYTSLHSNVFKGAIVMFLSEVLSNILIEEESNQVLYSYIEATLQWFDSNEDYSNFHLLFLLKLTKYLGFYPQESNSNLTYFNLQEGKFENEIQNKYAISGDNISVLNLLLGTKFDELSQIKISSKQRQSFLKVILLYFELHLGNFKTPKSLQVFNQVFH